MAAVLNRFRRALSNPQWSIGVICLVCFVAPALMIVQGAFKTEMFGTGGNYSAEMVLEVMGSPRTHSVVVQTDRKSTRLNSSHAANWYAVHCSKRRTACA